MKHSQNNIDQVTKNLLQRATVQTPSQDFTPRLMKLVEQKKSVEQNILAEPLLEEKKPWIVYTITGICAIIFVGIIFMLLEGVSFNISFDPDTMQMLSDRLLEYSQIFYASLQEFYLLPIVINITCLLIILDRFLRKKILHRI